MKSRGDEYLEGVLVTGEPQKGKEMVQIGKSEAFRV